MCCERGASLHGITTPVAQEDPDSEVLLLVVGLLVPPRP
jgi:hypothetical protein